MASSTNMVDLPEHILRQIHTYLAPETLGISAQVCKLFHKYSRENRDYLAVLRTEKAKRKRAADDLKRRQLIYIGLFRQRRAACFLNLFCLGKMKELFSMLCLILFTIFVTLKLATAVNWSWEVVFVPLLPIVYLLVCTPIALDIARLYSDSEMYELEAEDPFCRAVFFKHFFLQPLWDNEDSPIITRILIFTPIVTTFSFFILLLLRLNGIALQLHFVMIPLFLLGIYLAILPAAITSSLKGPDTKLLVVGGLVLLLFLVLLTLKLEGVISISWAKVFAPLFVILGVSFILAVLLLLSMCMEHRTLYRFTYFDDEDENRLIGIFLLLVLLPLLTLAILLVIYLDQHSIAFALVTIPIFILEVMATFGCCVMHFCDCIVVDDD